MADIATGAGNLAPVWLKPVVSSDAFFGDYLMGEKKRDSS
jgi:hypothetical protein